MPDPLLMDRMFQRIMRGLVETERAPHYAELARALGLPVEAGRRILHDVMQAYPIGWLHPATDYIASFPPLARPAAVSLTRHEPLPGGRACSPLAHVPAARGGGLHHARRPRRLLRDGDAPPHAGPGLSIGVVPAASRRAPRLSRQINKRS